MKKDKGLKVFRDHVRGKYYTDSRTLWEPFEGYSREMVEEFIELEAMELKRFFEELKTKGGKV